MVISNPHSFRVLFDKIASIYFIRKIYLYSSIGNDQPREPALCQLYRHTFVPYAFSALTLLVGRQEGHPACKKLERWCAGVVICLERGADLHMAQLMPLPLTVSCFSKIQTGFACLVPAHPGSPGQTSVKRVRVVRAAAALCRKAGGSSNDAAVTSRTV